MKAFLSRRNEKHQTPGFLAIMNNGEMLFRCRTLELKDMGNLKKLSRIPDGTYKVVKMIRPDGRNGLWVKNVPNRSAILIHSGNYAAGLQVDIEGCILIGMRYQDINNDGHLDIVESSKTFENLFNIVSDEFELTIFS